MAEHGHAHAAHDHGSLTRLAVVLALTVAFLLLEVAGALVSRSLALLADAGHMLADVMALGLALFAGWFSRRPAALHRTFGHYRVEVLAAACNAFLLFAMAAYILLEAWRRLQAPVEVLSTPMLAVAAAGLAVNVAGILLLGRAAGESMNLRAAYLEVVSDALGSVAVLLAGAVMALTGWWRADAVVSVLLGLFIIPRTWHLLRGAVDILLEAAPAGLDLAAVEEALGSVPGVASVHDLHVWSIAAGMESLTVHVVAEEGREPRRLLEDIHRLLAERFGLCHVTVQVEPVGFMEAGDGRCPKLPGRSEAGGR